MLAFFYSHFVRGLQHWYMLNTLCKTFAPCIISVCNNFINSSIFSIHTQAMASMLYTLFPTIYIQAATYTFCYCVAGIFQAPAATELSKQEIGKQQPQTT